MLIGGRVVAAAGAAVRMGTAFVGVSLVAAFVAPPGGPGPAGPDSAAGQAGRTDRATLRRAEGECIAHLTVADESGRDLATVTRWPGDGLSVVSRLGDQGVGFWLNETTGTAQVTIIVASRRVQIGLDRDGKPRIREDHLPPAADASEIGRSPRTGGPAAAPDPAIAAPSRPGPPSGRAVAPEPTTRPGTVLEGRRERP